jgi:sterol desaturase/sphingolipid hydroxylase (fatty acid hydroxylase superfamily)
VTVRLALERIIDSPANYWLAMVSDVVWALGFLVVGWTVYAGPALIAVTAVVAGFVVWRLLEYVTHRWVLHGPPSLFKRSHARHHGDTHALISTPFLVIFGAALVIRSLVGLVLPSGVATLSVFGLYAGYNYFSILHYFQHRHGATTACVGYWRKLLEIHESHHRHTLVNFGITTTIWDRLFGTFEPRPRS